MLVLIIANKEYLIDIILNNIHHFPENTKIKTLVATELPSNYDIYDCIIIDGEYLLDQKIANIFLYIKMSVIIIKNQDINLSNSFKNNNSISFLNQPINTQNFHELLKNILNHQPVNKYPYIYQSNTQNNTYYNKLQDSLEELSKSQEILGNFYGEFKNFCSNINNSLDFLSNKLNNKNHNNIYKEENNSLKNSIKESIITSTRNKNQQLFKNNFIINFASIKNINNIKNYLLQVMENIMANNIKNTLINNCIAMIQLLYYYYLIFNGKMENINDEKFKVILDFNAVTSIVEDKVYFNVSLKKNNNWEDEEFLFFYENYIYPPKINDGKNKITFTWNSNFIE